MNKFTILLLSLLIGALLASTAVFLLMNARLKNQSQIEYLQILHQQDMIDATRNSSFVHLMANVLDLMDDELKSNPKRTLSDETIARVVALCYSFKPYTHPEGDSLSLKILSPEKGQLLLAIAAMNMDSGSLHKIFSKASFSDADLRDANLSGKDLKGINLRGAYLHGANLEGVNLTGADLSFANLWGANLSEAILNDAKLKRADLGWANLNGAHLQKTDFNEADMTSAQLRKADLRGAILKWTELNGAFLNEADLTGAEMFRTGLYRSQLPEANLTAANLTLANIAEANLTKANLTGANLTDALVAEQNWLTLLDEWLVTGADEIKSKYKVEEETSSKQLRYNLKIIGNR